jgi:sulfatase maturation enzyme AslB (radical SAM superfamily)
MSLTNANSSEREQLAQALDYWAAGGDMELRYRSWMLNMCGNQRPANIRCRMGSDIFFLDVDASLYPCFHRRDVRMGNLLNERVEDVLDNAADTFARSLGQIKEAGCLTFGCLCFVQQENRPGNCSSNSMSV